LNIWLILKKLQVSGKISRGISFGSVKGKERKGKRREEKRREEKRREEKKRKEEMK
jgi:hypothetical protein